MKPQLITNLYTTVSASIDVELYIVYAVPASLNVILYVTYTVPTVVNAICLL